MKWTVTYYDAQVIKAIEQWPSKILAKYLRTIDLIEHHGPQIGQLFTKPIKNGLFEIRVKALEGIGRAFFCYQVGNEIIILHSFIKKTQKTPKKEIDIAIKRMKDVNE